MQQHWVGGSGRINNFRVAYYLSILYAKYWYVDTTVKWTWNYFYLPGIGIGSYALNYTITIALRDCNACQQAATVSYLYQLNAAHLWKFYNFALKISAKSLLLSYFVVDDFRRNQPCLAEMLIL